VGLSLLGGLIFDGWLISCGRACVTDIFDFFNFSKCRKCQPYYNFAAILDNEANAQHV